MENVMKDVKLIVDGQEFVAEEGKSFIAVCVNVENDGSGAEIQTHNRNVNPITLLTAYDQISKIIAGLDKDLITMYAIITGFDPVDLENIYRDREVEK